MKALPEVINLYKKTGETPLERINRLRVEYSEFKDTTLSYAGRLDPLAEGVMIVLVGDEANQKREQYLGLDKEYYFDVVFGVSTDTYDALGLVTDFLPIIQTDKPVEQLIDFKKLHEEMKEMKGVLMQEYPPFSSKTVKGKPLFEWAKEGRLGEIVMPQIQIEIYSLEIAKTAILSATDLKEKVKELVASVKGDFRQREIADRWHEVFSSLPSGTVFPSVTFKVVCSSGSYVRTIAHNLGKAFGIGAITLNIMRERVGNYLVSDSQR